MAVSTALHWVQGGPSHTDRVSDLDGRGRTKGDVAGVSQGGEHETGCDLEEEESSGIVVAAVVPRVAECRTGQTGRRLGRTHMLRQDRPETVRHCTIRNEQEYTTVLLPSEEDLAPCKDRYQPQSRRPSVVDDRKQQQQQQGELQDEIGALQRRRRRSSGLRTNPDGSQKGNNLATGRTQQPVQGKEAERTIPALGVLAQLQDTTSFPDTTPKVSPPTVARRELAAESAVAVE